MSNIEKEEIKKSIKEIYQLQAEWKKIEPIIDTVLDWNEETNNKEIEKRMEEIKRGN